MNMKRSNKFAISDDEDWAEAYRRGHAAAKAGVRVDGAVEANAALAAARRVQQHRSNEELKKFWAFAEWGVL